MKYVMTYRAVEDFLPLAQQHYAAHSARVDEFARRGVLLMVGTFTEPVTARRWRLHHPRSGRGVHRRRPVRPERGGRRLDGAAVGRGAAALSRHPDG
jgi:hypothetical protein